MILYYHMAPHPYYALNDHLKRDKKKNSLHNAQFINNYTKTFPYHKAPSLT